MPGEICNWETYLKWSNTTRTFTELSDWRFSDFISSEMPAMCFGTGAYSEPKPTVVVVNSAITQGLSTGLQPKTIISAVTTPTHSVKSATVTARGVVVNSDKSSGIILN
jgi:hypothetical protein